MSNKNEAIAVTGACDTLIARGRLQEKSAVGKVEFVPATDGSSDFVFNTSLVFVATAAIKGDRRTLREQYTRRQHYHAYLATLFAVTESTAAANFPHAAIDSKYNLEQMRQATYYLEGVLWDTPSFHKYLNNCYAMFRKTRRFIELDIDCKITKPFPSQDITALLIAVSVNGFEIDENGQANKIVTLAHSGLK